MSQSIEEITAAIGTTGEAFDNAVTAAVVILGQINDALRPRRTQLPPELRAVVDAITAMQGAEK